MVNYAELERIRDEMWKALEEHEKSLLNQEGEGSKSEDEEDGEDEGMFSDLKDEDIENSLLGELEPRVMPESGAEDTAQIVRIRHIRLSNCCRHPNSLLVLRNKVKKALYPLRR